MADRGGRRVRAGLIAADQALASARMFLLSTLSLRLLPASGFARFSLFYASYLFGTLLVRALTGDVANAAPADRGTRARQAAFVAAVLGVALAVPVLAAGLVTGSAVAWVMALGLPVLVLQDAIRMTAIATYDPALAVLNDGLWLGCFCVLGSGLLCWDRSRPVTLAGILLAWIAGALAAVAWCLARHRRLLPMPVRPLRWLSRHRSRGVPFAGEVCAQNGLAALATGAVAAVSGLHELALLKAASLVLGPVSLLLQAGGVFLVSEATRERGEAGRVRRLVRGSTTVMCGMLGCWLAGALLVPPSWLATAFGPTAVAARSILPFLGVCFGFAAATQASQSAVRALQRPRLAFASRACGAVLANGSLVVGAALAGGLGAAGVGMAGYGLALLVSRRVAGVALRPAGTGYPTAVPAARPGPRAAGPVEPLPGAVPQLTRAAPDR